MTALARRIYVKRCARRKDGFWLVGALTYAFIAWCALVGALVSAISLERWLQHHMPAPVVDTTRRAAR